MHRTPRAPIPSSLDHTTAGLPVYLLEQGKRIYKEYEFKPALFTA